MKYIIMCGGDYPAWETPRQMTVIGKDSIIERTIRFLRHEGVEDISISTNDERFEQFGVPLLHHENKFEALRDGSGSWVEAFYPMDEPACYIMGDVFFSPDGVRKIVTTETDSIMFFASAPPFSTTYIKPHAEPFAFKVTDQKRFKAAIDFVIANEHTGIFSRRPIAWELWQVINGENVREINFRNYSVITDYTCDVDNPEDVRMLKLLI